jgi:hypothetical protein
VKISAEQIVKNLIVDGVSVIPRGALVYLSTDDPKGLYFFAILFEIIV